MGWMKGTRWKRVFKSFDDEQCSKVFEHLWAYNITIDERATRPRPQLRWKPAPQETWLFVPIGDWPLAITLVSEITKN